MFLFDDVLWCSLEFGAQDKGDYWRELALLFFPFQPLQLFACWKSNCESTGILGGCLMMIYLGIRSGFSRWFEESALVSRHKRHP